MIGALAARGHPQTSVVWGSVQRLWIYRDLVRLLVLGDLKRTHADTILGHLWWLLDPLLTMMIYVVIISLIFKVGEPNYPLFILCAIIPWQGFSGSVVQASTALVEREALIRQVLFPKGVLIAAIVASHLFRMLCGFVVVFLGMILYGLQPSLALAAIPVLIVIQGFFTLGISFLTAAGGVYFRDLPHITSFVLRIWFLLSPALFSIKRIPKRLLPIYLLNPFAPLFEAYRAVILNGKWPELSHLMVALGVSTATLLIGFWWFSVQEQQLVRHL